LKARRTTSKIATKNGGEKNCQFEIVTLCVQGKRSSQILINSFKSWAIQTVGYCLFHPINEALVMCAVIHLQAAGGVNP
jgi:hypothetical protein